MSVPLSHEVVNSSIGRATFEDFYAGKAPWDIGKPQPRFVAIADEVTGPVLDAGCGTGENALFFASRGLRVTGIDFVPEAIERARRKAAERGLAVPADLSIVGFDDLDLSRVVVPRLTTVRQPLEEMARMGVELLLRLIDGREIDTLHIELATELVVRASTGPPPP